MAVNPNSVIDFLQSRKFAPAKNEKIPLFDFRKQLFSEAGLSPETGSEFRGTTDENLALVNFLSKAEKNAGVSISPDNVFDIIKLSRQGTLPSQAENALEAISGATGGTPEPGRPDLSSLFATPSPEEIASGALAEVTGTTKFPLQQEAMEAEKAALQIKGQADKEKTISELASRGLVFSGKKKQSLEAIDADTLAKQLGVDREFALLIAGGLDTAAQRIAKEAQAGNKDALASLEKLGYTVNPLTGEIEQTLEAQKAIASEERALRKEEFDMAKFQIDTVRTEQLMRQTEQAMALARSADARAGLNLQLNYLKEQRISQQDYNASMAGLVNLVNEAPEEDKESVLSNGYLMLRLGFPDIPEESVTASIGSVANQFGIGLNLPGAAGFDEGNQALNVTYLPGDMGGQIVGYSTGENAAPITAQDVADFGQGNFAKIKIDDRVRQLRSSEKGVTTGQGTESYIRTKLRQEGYRPEAIDRVTKASFLTKLFEK